MNLFYYTCKLATTAKGMGGDSLPIRPQVDTKNLYSSCGSCFIFVSYGNTSKCPIAMNTMSSLSGIVYSS